MAFAFNAATIEDSFILNNTNDTIDSKLSKKTLDTMMVNNIEHIHDNLIEENEQEDNFNLQQEVKPTINNEPSYSLLSYNETNDTEYKKEDTMMNKMNHILELLEEDKLIKTNQKNEEIVLYCFLGFFIIYVLDSFVSIGKYSR